MDSQKLVGLLPAGMKVSFGEPLSRHTGFKTGGTADAMVWPESREQLIHTVAALKSLNIPWFILGNGTNVLALDEGYRGVVVKTERALLNISRAGNTVTCGAGVFLRRLCEFCLERGLSGLEFAFGIPGTVGGALFMNAGAYGGEMTDVVMSAEAVMPDGTIRTLDSDGLNLSYRTSAVESLGAVVLNVTFSLKTDKKELISGRMTDYMARRKEKQPLELPSCGSTFKRPEGAYASKLIEDCGLKGFAVGGAAVSTKHSGFVVNTGGATSDDVLAVCEHVQKTVKEMTGYQLALEVRVLR